MTAVAATIFGFGYEAMIAGMIFIFAGGVLAITEGKKAR
jgi:hypothetical protein